MTPAAAFFWRRLDQPGHDSCRLFRVSSGWVLSGAAVFKEGAKPCHFHYEVATTATWRTRRAHAVGFVGNRRFEVRLVSAGKNRWTVDGKPAPRIDGCADVDLGFTPSTNLIAIRRLALRVGERAEAPAAYLAIPQMRIMTLPQTYRRLSRSEYAYESPTSGYAGTLEVTRIGAVASYPGVFALVTRT